MVDDSIRVNPGNNPLVLVSVLLHSVVLLRRTRRVEVVKCYPVVQTIEWCHRRAGRHLGDENVSGDTVVLVAEAFNLIVSLCRKRRVEVVDATQEAIQGRRTVNGDAEDVPGVAFTFVPAKLDDVDHFGPVRGVEVVHKAALTLYRSVQHVGRIAAKGVFVLTLALVSKRLHRVLMEAFRDY